MSLSALFESIGRINLACVRFIVLFRLVAFSDHTVTQLSPRFLNKKTKQKTTAFSPTPTSLGGYSYTHQDGL